MNIKDLDKIEYLIEVETVNEAAMDFLKQINAKFASFFSKDKTIKMIKSLKNIGNIETEKALNILKQFYQRGPKIDPDKNKDLIRKATNNQDFDKLYRRAFDGLYRMTKGNVPNSVLSHSANLIAYMSITKDGKNENNIEDILKDAKSHLEKQKVLESTNLNESVVVGAAASIALLSFFSISIIDVIGLSFTFGSFVVIGIAIYLIIGAIVYTVFGE